jgi:hypothetical protein
MPRGYVLVFYWTVAALGAALLVGTSAALVRYVRTGTFPGQLAEQPAADAAVLRRVVLRACIGLSVTIAGLVGVLSVGSSAG